VGYRPGVALPLEADFRIVDRAGRVCQQHEFEVDFGLRQGRWRGDGKAANGNKDGGDLHRASVASSRDAR
jgi:hypothetical protein